MAKKINDPQEIDESFIIASIKQDKSAKAQPNLPIETESEPEAKHSESEQPKEENRRKKVRQDYESLFFKEAGIVGRGEKSTYLRKEYYDRIAKIIQVTHNNRINVFSYIDNVLSYHFETFRQEITDFYNKKNTDLF